MSANHATLKALVEAFNAHDLDRYVKQIDDAYVGESELVGHTQGPVGVRQSLQMLFGGFPDLRLEVEQMLPSGDFLVTSSRLTGTHKGSFLGIAPTNKAVSWKICNVVEVRNGKIVKNRLYGDTASLLQQIGAISLPRPTAAGTAGS